MVTLTVRVNKALHKRTPYPEVEDANLKCISWIDHKQVSALWNLYCSHIKAKILCMSEYEAAIRAER